MASAPAVSLPVPVLPSPAVASQGWMKTVKDVVAGTCGGISVTLVGHPFDTLKIRLQSQPIDKPIYCECAHMRLSLMCFYCNMQWGFLPPSIPNRTNKYPTCCSGGDRLREEDCAMGGPGRSVQGGCDSVTASCSIMCKPRVIK